MVSTSGSSGTGFRELDVDDTVANFGWVVIEGSAGVMRALAGGGIEFPGVPGANDEAVEKVALGEGTAGMGTEAVERADFAVVIAEKDREVFVLPGGHGTGRQLDERDGGNRSHQSP
jgi:hypothetical protein